MTGKAGQAAGKSTGAAAGMAAGNAKKAGLWTTVSAVLWGFLGVRRNADYQKDIERLNPLHLMAVGVALAFVFVLGLIALAKWAVTVA